jgi:hypothetical protein
VQLEPSNNQAEGASLEGPSGAKARYYAPSSGTAEAAPFPKPFILPKTICEDSFCNQLLLRRYQRVRNCVHRKRNPILHAHLAHQLRHVRLDRALFNP